MRFSLKRTSPLPHSRARCRVPKTMPSTIAALKNHHVYVLAKSLRKFDGVRPGAKAAGLVKGCKVYLKSDVSKLRGASRWKQDGLQVRLFLTSSLLSSGTFERQEEIIGACLCWIFGKFCLLSGGRVS